MRLLADRLQPTIRGKLIGGYAAMTAVILSVGLASTLINNYIEKEVRFMHSAAMRRSSRLTSRVHRRATRPNAIGR